MRLIGYNKWHYGYVATDFLSLVELDEVGEVMHAATPQKTWGKKYDAFNYVAIVGACIFEQWRLGIDTEEKIIDYGDEQHILQKAEHGSENGVEHTDVEHLHRASEHFREDFESGIDKTIDNHGGEHTVDKC